MVAAKNIPFEEVTTTEELLERATGQPIIVEFRGERFRIVGETEVRPIQPTPNNKKRDDLWKNYDPKKAIAALDSAVGYLDGIDIEELKQWIREERGQYSSGRPYDEPQ